jgi:hypothetical protein
MRAQFNKEMEQMAAMNEILLSERMVKESEKATTEAEAYQARKEGRKEGKSYLMVPRKGTKRSTRDRAP